MSQADRATAETVEAESIKTVMTLKAYFCCINSAQAVVHTDFSMCSHRFTPIFLFFHLLNTSQNSTEKI